MTTAEAPLTVHTALTGWQLAPQVAAGLAAAGALYLVGVVLVWRRHPSRPWPWLRTLSFVGGLTAIAVATQSSVARYDDQLFWIHMVQHLLLIMVAPPLLVVGRPVILLMHASRNPVHRWVRAAVRSRLVSGLTCPPVAWGIYTATVVGTHLTGFMNVTLTHPFVHDMEHLLYLVAGYLFFLPLLGSEPIRWRMSYPARFLYLVVAMPVDTFVGVVLAQTDHEPFPAYLGRRTWGPSPVADLHAGGAVMWIGGDALMLVFLLVVFVQFLRDRDSQGSAGVWLEGVRRRTLADQAAAAGVVAPGGRGGRGFDDDESALAAYNAYLGALARRRRTDPPPG